MAQNTYSKRTPPPPRVDLVTKEFDDLIEDQGVRVRITPSILCPSRSGLSEDTSDVNHKLNCEVCDGSQIVDLDDDSYDDWVFIQGVRIEKQLNMQEIFDMKDAFMTSRGSARLGYWFKIEILDFGSQFNELVLRGTGDVDRVRYPEADPMDGSFFAMIGGDGSRYVRDVDYSVDGRDLTWLTPNRPASSTLYSYFYPVLPTFRILEFMHENRYYYDGFKRPDKIPVQLPQQCHIRWDFMAKRQGSDVQS